MGRGRAKAKQTKVARGLKYRDQGTDFDKLAEELHGGGGARVVFDDDRSETVGYDQWSDYSDPWSELTGRLDLSRPPFD